jgi:hypothetical protein
MPCARDLSPVATEAADETGMVLAANSVTSPKCLQDPLLALRGGDGGMGPASGLLFERLAPLGQEPCILHGDDHLGREILSSAICLSVNRRTPWRLAAM